MPLCVKPGEGYLYDNSGYIFLGCIIEKVTGGSYEDYLKKNIFEPLGMNASGYDNSLTVLKGRAKGYSGGPQPARNADYLDMTLPYAAGSLYSTVGDLYLWDRALYKEKVISKKSIEAMTTVVRHNYGYGLQITAENNHKQVAHGGGINGFATWIGRFPDDDAVVILLSNFEGANPGALGKQLGAILLETK